MSEERGSEWICEAITDLKDALPTTVTVKSLDRLTAALEAAGEELSHIRRLFEGWTERAGKEEDE